MSTWTLGDGCSSASTAQSREILESWTASEGLSNQLYDANRSDLKTGLNKFLETSVNKLQSLDIGSNSFAAKSCDSTSESFENIENTNTTLERLHPRNPKEQFNSPIAKIHNILADDSASSQWLQKHGYPTISLEEPGNTLEVTIAPEINRGGTKVSATVRSLEGTRTVVAYGDGSSVQRVLSPAGKELVRFASNGQILEVNRINRANNIERTA